MNFDAMGSYYGAVNDMLEPPTTEANVKPVTQTITTDPKTGEQMMTVKGRPEDLSAANPNTPTVTPAAQPTFNFGAPQMPPGQYMNLANSADRQPVPYQAPAAPAPQATQPTAPVAPAAPDQTFQRMVQAESGGQNFAPNGQPLTSPAGAMFANQVMPSTAMNPGYGVRPAAAQTPEEYNRVGQDYYQAMLKQFGNPQAAAAAYNAGPGRVQQNIQQNQGQLNVAQLPQETQAYLQRVQPGAVPAPVAPAAPTPPMIAGTPSSDVGMTPTEQAMRQQAPMTPDQQYAKMFIDSQNDPASLSKLRYDKNAPPVIRELASQIELRDLKYKDETAKVEQQVKTAIENGDGRALANMLNPRREKDEEGVTPGRIAKAFLYSLIGFQSGAAAEVEKMGLKDKWDTAQIGTDQVAVLSNPRGEAKEAVYTSGPLAGRRVPDDQLATLYGAGAGGKVTTSGTFFQTPDGAIVVSQRDEKGRTKMVDSATGERYRGSSKGLVKLEEAGALRKMDYGLITDLKKQFGTDAIKAATKFQELAGPFKTDAERSQFLQIYGFGQAQPTTMPSAPPPSGVVTPPAPAAPPVPNTVLPGQQADQGLVRQPPGAVAPVAPTPINAPATVPSTVPSAGPALTTPLSTLETARAGERSRVEEAGKITGKSEGEVAGKDIKNQNFADSSYSLIKPISDAIKESTGSTLGAGVDTVAGAIGKSTKGAQAIAKLDVLGYSLVSNVPRFEGPQGVRDVELYERAAGDLANSKKPVETRLAALDAVITLLKKYDKAGTNDWTFSGESKEAGRAETPQEKARREIELRKKGNRT